MSAIYVKPKRRKFGVNEKMENNIKNYLKKGFPLDADMKYYLKEKKEYEEE